MTRDLVPPQARTTGLIVRETPDDVLVYDEEHRKAHCLNRAAAVVWRACDGRRTVSTIAASLGDGVPIRAREASVLLALRQLDAAQLLEQHLDRHESAGISRRKLIARLGAAAAVTLPLVTSITHAQDGQASCIGVGDPCDPQADQCCAGSFCGQPGTIAASNLTQFVCVQQS